METRAHLDKILAHYEISAPDAVEAPMQPVSPRQLVETGSWLRTVWGKCSEQQERMRRLRDELRRAAHSLRALDQFAHVSIDLALLQREVRCCPQAIKPRPKMRMRSCACLWN